MYRAFQFSIFVFIMFSKFGITQSNVDPRKIDSEFTRAVELYDAKRYNSALFRFEKIINDYHLNTKTSAAYFFKIKILPLPFLIFSIVPLCSSSSIIKLILASDKGI